MKKNIAFFRRIRRNKRGFSLVEAIVATAIVVVISTTMLGLFVQGNYYIGRANALRVQASEANESIKLGKAVSSAKNTVTHGTSESYKIKTSLNFQKNGAVVVRTGGTYQKYVFVVASSKNTSTETKVEYADFVRVDYTK